MFASETEKIIKTAINSEKENAIEIYGPTYNSDHEGYAVLKEEIEEADSALKYIQDELCDLWKVIKLNEYPKYKQVIIKRIVKEATKVLRKFWGVKKMTDEEKAEEYAGEKCKECYMCDYADNERPEINPYEVCPWYTKRKEGYLDGLKEGKPKWHYLRKNPDDLPKRTGEYFTNIGLLYYDKLCNRHFWHTPSCEACDYSDEVEEDEVIAWCELPQFKE